MLNDFSASRMNCITDITIHIQHQQIEFAFLYNLTHIQWHKQGGGSSTVHPGQLSQRGGKMGNKMKILNGKKN
jgi:hypothetical protein